MALKPSRYYIPLTTDAGLLLERWTRVAAFQPSDSGKTWVWLNDDHPSFLADEPTPEILEMIRSLDPPTEDAEPE